MRIAFRRNGKSTRAFVFSPATEFHTTPFLAAGSTDDEGTNGPTHLLEQQRLRIHRRGGARIFTK